MNKQEAIDIMETLYSAYPNFNKKNINSFNTRWIGFLLKGDYEKTLIKTEQYIEESPFPPAPANIIVPVHKPTNTELTDMKKARETVEHENNDPEQRARREEMLRRFDQKLEELRQSGK